MIDLLLSVLLYAGLAAIAVSLVALVKPLRRLRLGTRRKAVVFALAGAAAVLLAALSAPAATTVVAPRHQLDVIAPTSHFREHHATVVNAAPADVFAAIKATTASDIALFQTFTWLRRFGTRGPESILNAPEHLPILEVATRTTFLSLFEQPGREVVIGTVVVAPDSFRRWHITTPAQFVTVTAPGFATATMNFVVSEQSPGSVLLSTETRVFATDATALRRFTPYWRLIYPGSALLRLTWLRAIKTRAEQQRPA